MDQPPDPDAPRRSELRSARDPGRRTLPLLIAGGLLTGVLVTGLALWVFREDKTAPQPELTEENVGGGLEIELSQNEVGRIDPNRPLRCFVGGRFVGELTVAKCAERNGVQTQGLDVGLDESGALTAAISSVPPPITDIPVGPLVEGPAEPAAEPPPPVPATQDPPGGACMRNAAGEWRNLGDGLTLDTCVQVLFSGRCEPPGGAQYGRWNGQSLRLVAGGVEIADGGGYRPLVSQDPQTCLIQ
jgi:hypothetical protein